MWHVRPRVKKSRRRYISSNGKSKRKCCTRIRTRYVYTSYLESSPFVLALEGDVNSNPSSREVILEDGIYPLSVAYRFLGYVLVLLQRCTHIYVQQYCSYCFFFCFCHRDAYCRCLSCFVCHHGLDFRKRASREHQHHHHDAHLSTCSCCTLFLIRHANCCYQHSSIYQFNRNPAIHPP